MNDFYSIELNNCINEFISFYNQDNYISKKRLDDFLDKYQDIFKLLDKYQDKTSDLYKKVLRISQDSYRMIDRKNEEFVKRHLELDKEYFDTLFNEVDSNIVLDEEQRRAILIDEDYSLIVAGAGSGKTTTMAAKVKYLVDKKNILPQNIILLSFTNKATDELNEILNNKFKLNVEVLTFHKLGMKFIRNIATSPIQIISDNGIYKVLSNYFVENIFKNKKKLEMCVTLFDKYLHLNDICYSFDSYEEYYRAYMDLKYDEEKNNLDKYISKRVKERRHYLKTINGEYVKSLGEFNIANYLYKHGIDYTYEEVYPYRLRGRSYSPDFTIHEIDHNIYLEYYGLAVKRIDGTHYSESATYAKEILSKREFHKDYDSELIELYGRYESGDFYLPLLAKYLNEHNVDTNINIRTNKDIFYRLMETSKDAPYMNLIRLFAVFISLFKEFNYGVEDFDILKSKTKDDVIVMQLDILKEVFIYYEKTIHESGRIDFQDMISYAYKNMDFIKDRKQYINYDYVIIDEYQDISLQRHNFAKKISDLFQAKIVAVGDDWQTIFSFSGSDIQLFTKFYDSMGYAEIIKITNTYRNSQELIDLAGNFVCQNDEQIFKSLKSNKHLEHPVELVEYDYNKESDNLAEVLSKLIKKLYDNNPNDRILLLIRFNSEISNLLDSKYFYKKSNLDDKIYCKACPNADIDIMSVHKSKGLGYDQVILLNALNIVRGFPSLIKDHPVIKYIKDDTLSESISENIAYPEERRLFYVAMTRTKNKLYIMTPYNYSYRSEFINEIESDSNVIVNDDYIDS